ncbi:hypothetical protein PR202_ga11964 [Eleusine coracana subsp. coracana]|uniref:K Homology domain-containing protein n=1 Tax=Eleusine coracana subsp. coracana TaxID=191504 RepID=A0AAV5CB04_ELECO|nr:hypothetical protein PR202_ga11964 [Eleusine coracana subsp. coracana]
MMLPDPLRSAVPEHVHDYMDGQIENPLENTMTEVPTNLDNDEQASPVEQEEFQEEQENAYEEEPKGPSDDELVNPEHEDVKTESVGDLNKVEEPIPLQEEVAIAYGEEAEAKQKIVGAVIGRKGDFIKKMCEESKARIKVLEGPQGAPERAVMISAKDEPDAELPPAVDGLLRVHKRITDGLDGEPDQPQRGAATIGPTRLLVPASQAGSLIGKQGATIKSIQDASKCVLRILENVPPVALNDDRVVEIQGEPLAAHKAVELIANESAQCAQRATYAASSAMGSSCTLGSSSKHASSWPRVTHSMQVPLSYADAVIGKSGASITYIRRHSGATISIQEGAPGEMTVEITGTASQIQTAQQLIKNFMVEASPQGPPPGPAPPAQTIDAGYNSYPPYGGASYGSPPGGAGPGPQGNYGSVYAPSYGY